MDWEKEEDVRKLGEVLIWLSKVGYKCDELRDKVVKKLFKGQKDLLLFRLTANEQYVTPELMEHKEAWVLYESQS